MAQNWNENHTENVPVYYPSANRGSGDIFKPFMSFFSQWTSIRVTTLFQAREHQSGLLFGRNVRFAVSSSSSFSYSAHLSPERETRECGSSLHRLLSGNPDDMRYHVVLELKSFFFVKVKCFFENVCGKCDMSVLGLLKTASFHR